MHVDIHTYIKRREEKQHRNAPHTFGLVRKVMRIQSADLEKFLPIFQSKGNKQKNFKRNEIGAAEITSAHFDEPLPSLYDIANTLMLSHPRGEEPE